jgi:uncharacterized protein (TIGR01777 family)
LTVRVLITGVTGFVGSRLADRLAAEGHEVVGLSRDAASARRKVPLLAEAHAWSPTQEEPPAAALDGVHAVIHLLGESVVGRWTAAKRRAIRESRTVSTRNLVAAMARRSEPPKVLVSASAIGYYGDRGDEVLDETSGPGSDFLAEVCREWEAAAREAEAFTRVVRLRIGLVMDPAGGPLEAMLRPFRLGLGGPLGSGRQWWSWITRDDLVALMLWALEREEVSGALNATSPDPLRQAEFARVLASAVGRWSLLPAPRAMLKVALGGFSAELLASRRVVPKAASEGGFTFGQPDLGQALTLLLGATP